MAGVEAEILHELQCCALTPNTAESLMSSEALAALYCIATGHTLLACCLHCQQTAALPQVKRSAHVGELILLL